jgi:Tfp pilus assembly PilM family ATPase
LTVNNEINSTEKLLDVIRGKNIDPPPAIEKNIEPSPKRQKASNNILNRPRTFSIKKIYTIGVDIGYGVIRLYKAARSADSKSSLIDYKVVDYDSKIVKGSIEFNTILKSALVSFSGNPSECNIWTIMSTAEVNVHHIKIPRVAKKLLDNVIYWTAKKETSFDEKDSIFDYEVQGEIVDQGLPKYSVMVYSAPVAEVEKVRTLFSNIGITLAGITITPFAIQNIIRKGWMPSGEGAMATLFIGNDFSRIDIFNRENLVMTRGIKTGITSMMEAIAETLSESNRGLRLGKEEAKKILFSINTDSEKLHETDPGFGLKEEQIFEMVLPPLERLVRQVERTLEYYTSTMGFEKVERIYVSSSMSIYEPIVHYISEQLGVRSEIFDPFKQHAAHPALEGLSPSGRMFLSPALGLSLSDNLHTPNFIFTYKQKNREIYIRTLNKSIFAAFGLALVVCLATLAYQVVEAKVSGNKIAQLEKDISRYNPLLTNETIEKMAAQLSARRQISSKYAERYTQLAVIGEISDLTPANIGLMNIKITLADPAAKEKPEKAQQTLNEGIVLEGVISGNRNMLDSLLTQYVMKLEYSPILRQVSVTKSTIIKFNKSEVLQFTLNARIG